jgi:hypothetical protein
MKIKQNYFFANANKRKTFLIYRLSGIFKNEFISDNKENEFISDNKENEFISDNKENEFISDNKEIKEELKDIKIQLKEINNN